MPLICFLHLVFNEIIRKSYYLIGDTTFAGLTKPALSFVFTAEILILEVTYLDGDMQKCIDRGHVHLQNVADGLHLFRNNHIVIVHISQKYWNVGNIINKLKQSLPAAFLARCALALRGFGSNHDLTVLKRDLPGGGDEAQPGWGWGRRVTGK